MNQKLVSFLEDAKIFCLQSVAVKLMLYMAIASLTYWQANPHDYVGMILAGLISWKTFMSDPKTPLKGNVNDNRQQELPITFK